MGMLVPTRVAIYARVSKEQKVADESKSPTRQTENARAFALERGWTVSAEHEFVDDGKSGAEFAKRPGLMRMMGTLEPRAPFTVLVVSEQKSLGREAFETQMLIKTLALAGVEVWSYMDGRCLTPKNWMDKVMSAFRAGADEAHREDTAARMREAHTRLAKRGHVTGGRVFGYENYRTDAPDASGARVPGAMDRRIVKREAAVILRIFRDYADGHGLKRIARELNADRAPSPKYTTPKDGLPPLGRWCPSTVRAILGREIYHGDAVRNKLRKRNDWGQLAWSKRPESEWVHAEREDLRIVPEELWSRVQARRRETEGRTLRFESGRLSGRPPKGEARNLLAGLATCGVCGGGMIADTSGGKRRDAFGLDDLPAPGAGPSVARGGWTHYHFYVCSRRRQYSECSNALRVSVDEVNEAVLQAVEEHVLTPEAVEAVIALSERDELRDRRDHLEGEASAVRQKLGRFQEAIAVAPDLGTVLDGIRKQEARLREIEEELGGLRPVPRLAPEVVESRLGEWRKLLRGSVTQGRAVLQRVIRGRITFTPRVDGQGYDFAATTRFDRLFAGVVIERPSWIKPGTEGTEGIRFEDTMESSYEEILARAQKTSEGESQGDASPLNGWRPWRDSNPRSSP